MKIKILFLTNDLGLGGVQRLVVDFANFFNKDEFEVRVATLFNWKESFFYRDRLGADIPLEVFNFQKVLDFGGWRRLYKYIRHEKFDIVFSQLFAADFVGRIAAKLAGVPLIVTEIQNIIPNLPKKYIWTDWLLSKITDVCISTTQAVTDYGLQVVGFPKRKIFDIPTNAVDASRFQIKVDRVAIRKSLGLPIESRIIINVGRLVEQKGQHILVEAAPKILKEEPHAYFLIAGSGPLQPKLQAQINRLGIGEHFKLLGDRKDIPELLMSSDVFAFPSIWEGQGLILFECFFSKIPIVASNTGGIPDVIKHEETGLLAEPGNADDLAKNILRVLKDQTLAKNLANTAFVRYGDRTMENAIRKMENLFKDLLVKKKHGNS